MANEYDLPSTDVSQTPTRMEWRQWFARAHRILQSVQSYGTTANRPTTFLWPGRFFFDETLGIPIWVQSVRPTVWVNAAGVVV